MKQYNIYAGLSGFFGGANYQYTSLFDTHEDAEKEAYKRACAEYQLYEGLHGLYDYQNVIDEYCEELDINSESNLTNKDWNEIDTLYTKYMENWLDYYAISTDEDNLSREELILDYTVEDDSTSQTSSK